MTKITLFTTALLLMFSCTNTSEKKENTIESNSSITLEFASKNPVTAGDKEGTHVEAAEMLHFSLSDNSSEEFVGKTLTLNNPVEYAINFSFRNDSVFCVSPSPLVLMSMPPKPGVRPAMIESEKEFFVNPMSLLKFEDVNIMFVGLGE